MERLSDEQLSELATRARSGDVAARNRIVEANIALAGKACAMTRHVPMDDPDRLQEARVSLIEAASKYDPGNGAAFSTYYLSGARRAVARASDRGRLVRVPINALENCRTYRDGRHAEAARRAKGKAVGLDDAPAPSSTPADPAQDLDDREAIASMREAIDALPTRMGELIRLQLDGRSVEMAGRMLGMTKNPAHEMNRRAMDLIRLRMGIAPVHHEDPFRLIARAV